MTSADRPSPVHVPVALCMGPWPQGYPRVRKEPARAEPCVPSALGQSLIGGPHAGRSM
jgi:hypothetical protein